MQSKVGTKNKQSAFDLHSSVCVYGDQSDAIQAMVDYDYYCNKKATAIHCIINPSLVSESFSIYFYGNKEITIPAYPSLKDALAKHTIDILVNFASARSAFAVTKEAITSPIKTIVVIAEGMPERQARILKALAAEHDKFVIGPATVGGLVGGVVKVGNAGGTIENVIENKLNKRGSVGIVSKSGGMLNELMTIVARNTNGVCEAIAIGGDRFPVTTLAEQVLRFDENPDIKLIFMLGEVGGTQEVAVAELVKNGRVKKPVIAWVSGSGAKAFSENIQFGHAGAMANSDYETTEAKVKLLQDAGIIIPSSYSAIEEIMQKTADRLGIGYIQTTEETMLEIHDFAKLVKRGDIRYRKNVITSISKKSGSDETYLGKDIASVSKEKGIGYIIGLLWFKQEFPESITALLELMVKLSADHGPAVATAHNTIVASRAGKDLLSSLVSGLLTIGPRHGGAVNDAAMYFKDAFDLNLPPYSFVEEMKAKGINIPGIGHRVKSKTNPDKRVAMLTEVARKAMKETPYLDYAFKVEEITTRKKDMLILNVDGAMAVILLDILNQYFTSKEIDELIKMEALNGFFILSRSIGLIGHYIDQKRLGQGLYRHPEWDVLEVE